MRECVSDLNAATLEQRFIPKKTSEKDGTGSCTLTGFVITSNWDTYCRVEGELKGCTGEDFRKSHPTFRNSRANIRLLCSPTTTVFSDIRLPE